MSASALILVVDDGSDNRKIYCDLLEQAGYSVRSAPSADKALSAAQAAPPDLILSDVAMPGGGGLELVARLRSDPRTARVPVILMSGVHTDADEQAEGLEQGADDYLAKPVPPQLLRAKVAAVLRRYSAPKELDTRLKAEGLTLDVAARTVTVRGRRVALTRKEFDLLTALLRRQGEALTIAYLLETVWGYDPETYSDPHTVAAHVWTLKRKIGEKLAARIVAVPGVGYRFDP